MPKDIETGGAGFTEVDMGRRRALAKLGLSFVAVYTAPFLLRIHHAAADGNGGGDGDGGGDGSGGDGSGGSGHDDDHGPSGSGPSGHAASGAADEGAVTAASSEATTVSLSESAAPAATSAPSVTSTPSTPSVPTTPAVPTVPVAGSGEGGDDTLWFLAEVRQALLGLMSAYYVAGLGDGAGGPEQVQIVAELAAKLVSYKP